MSESEQRGVGAIAEMLFGSDRAEAAFNDDGVMVQACFADHPQFGEWAKRMIAEGHEVRTISIDQLCHLVMSKKD